MRVSPRTVRSLSMIIAVSLLAWLAAGFSPAQAQGGCAELLLDGGFEAGDAWELGITPLTPEYVTYTQHSGYRSLAMGITKGGNRPGFSSARQSVFIPAFATRVTLSFWVYTMVEGLPGADTMQLVLLNPDGTTLHTLWSSSNDSRLWNQMSFDVTRWRGRAVQVYFNVVNDGVGGTAGMFLDDVSMVACPAPAPTGTLPSAATATKTATAPTPTKTATAPTATKTATAPTPTKTATAPTATKTATPGTPGPTQTNTARPPTATRTSSATSAPIPATATPIVIPGLPSPGQTATAISGPPAVPAGTPAATAAIPVLPAVSTRPLAGTPAPFPSDACPNLVQNGGFEEGLAGWRTYAPDLLPPQIVEAPGGVGGLALLLGTQAENQIGNSTAQQTVSIPAGVERAVLSFRISAWAESSSGADIQEALVFDAQEELIATLWSGLADDRTWRVVTSDLTSHAGQDVTLFFSVFNDGAGGKTALLVDDVRLVACAAGSGSPQLTQTPEARPTEPAATAVALTIWPNPTWANFAPQMTRIALPSPPGPPPTRGPAATATPAAAPTVTERLSDWLDRITAPAAIAFSVFLVMLLVILIIWQLRGD